VYNYDQPSKSVELIDASEKVIVPAPAIWSRKLTTIHAFNRSDNETMILELWDYTSGLARQLISRTPIRPRQRFELVEPIVMFPGTEIRCNLQEAPTKFLAVSATWQDSFEYHEMPGLVDYWRADKGLTPRLAADGFRIQNWLGQFAGLSFDNLVPSQQPKFFEDGGLNDQAYLDFVNSRNDFLAMVFGVTKAQPLTLLMVAEYAGATGQYLWDGIDVTNRAFYKQTAAQMELNAGLQVLHSSDAAFKLTNIHAFGLSGASSTVHSESPTPIVTGNASTNGLAGVTVGGDYLQTPAAAADIKIYELAIIETSLLTQNMLNQWAREMGARYNRPWV
jgi:hypothetical protein